ncbi:MAG: hypothetical protein C0596_04255 [Marinilabiliales bacterium]|nr:MAG: hypothetical protein C0596_04255 [Marinilabiliales bacterium]
MCKERCFLIFPKTSRFNRNAILLLIFLINVNIIYSSTLYKSKISGMWSVDSVWYNNSAPALSSSDIISTWHEISTLSDVTIKTNGTLEVKSGSILTVYNMEFSNGSNIIIEENGKLIVL